MNPSQQGQRPQSLLTMLPPQVQKQVLLLIKRLGDEKQAKQQFQKKCIIQEQEIQQLKKQIDKLKKQNLTLKTKWENSFTMISKVRQNFSGCKKNLYEGQGKKKLRFNKEQNEWTEQQESQKEQKETINKEMQPTIKISQQYKMKQQQAQKYFSISQTGIPVQTMTSVQISRSLQKSNGLETLPVMTAKKPPRQQALQQSSSRSKLSNRSNKKQQIQSLKQEIESLTQEIKTKQMGNMSYADKMKRCEQIKNRYKKGGNVNNNREEQRIDESRFSNNNNSESFMINSGYHSPRKYQDNHPNMQTVKNPNMQTVKSQHLHSNRQSQFSQQKSIPYQQQTSTNSNLIINRGQQSWKENIMINDSNKSIEMSKKPYSNNLNMTQHQHQQQRVQSNSSFLNNTSAIYSNSKIAIKQPNQSFYDDGLLDLIEEMNP